MLIFSCISDKTPIYKVSLNALFEVKIYNNMLKHIFNAAYDNDLTFAS